MQLSQITAAAPEFGVSGNAVVMKWPEAQFAALIEADGRVGQFASPHSRFEVEVAVVHHIERALRVLREDATGHNIVRRSAF